MQPPVDDKSSKKSKKKKKPRNLGGMDSAGRKSMNDSVIAGNMLDAMSNYGATSIAGGDQTQTLMNQSLMPPTSTKASKAAKPRERLFKAKPVLLTDLGA